MIVCYRIGIVEIYTLPNFASFAALIVLGMVVAAVYARLCREPPGALLAVIGYVVLGLLLYVVVFPMFVGYNSGVRIVLVVGALHSYPLLAFYMALQVFQARRKNGQPTGQAMLFPLLIALPAGLIYLIFTCFIYL